MTTKIDVFETIRTNTEKTCTLITDELLKISKEPLSKKDTREFVMSILNIDKETERFCSAFESIVDYMQRCCAPVELNDVKDNWTLAIEKFNKTISEETILNQNILLDSLQDFLGISPETYTLFYNAGKSLYDEQSFQKAADVFFFLAYLNYSYYNVWFSLGLAEQNCRCFDAALKAFAMATILNFASPEPFLHGAECCIEMGDPYEADSYLTEADYRIKKSEKNQFFNDYLNYLANLRKK